MVGFLISISVDPSFRSAQVPRLRDTVVTMGGPDAFLSSKYATKAEFHQFILWLLVIAVRSQSWALPNGSTSRPCESEAW